MIKLKLLVSPIRSASGKLRHTVAEFEQGTAVCDMLPDDFEGRYILDGGCLLENVEDDPRYRKPLYGEHEIWAIPQIGDPATLIIIGIALVVGIGLTLAATYLLAPPRPDLNTDDDSSPTTNWRGITTTQGPGAVVPVIYGRHRVGGQLLHADVGYNDQSQADGAFPNSPLDILIALGEGYIEEIETSTIELNDQPIANFTDIQAATTNGTSGQSALAHHENIQQTFARSPADDLTSGTVTYTTTQDVNGFVIEVQYPNGLFEFRKSGEKAENRTTWRFRYRVSPAGGWSAYTTITNASDQRKVIYSTRKIENLALDTYDIGIEYVSSDHTDSTRDAWQPYLTNITEIIDQTNAYENTALLGLRTVSQAGLEGNLPNITVIVKGRRIRVAKFSDVNVTNATNATPIVITTDGAHGYSNGAIIRIKGVAGNTAANGTWAISSASGSVFTLDGSAGNGAYTTGGIAVAETWSDNPAWCLMDLMTHERYGLGIPDAEIDLTAFVAYAAYCDSLVDDGAAGTEKRNLLDLVIDTDMSAQEGVLKILRTTRAIMIKSQGMWRPRVSQDDSPVQLISWSNIVRDSLRIEYKRDIDKVNVIEAQFADRDLDFETDVLTWPSVDNWPTEIRKSAIDLIGITRPSQAMRELKFELARRQLSKLYITFEAGIDQIVLEHHDIFRFSHPLPAWGQAGRVAAGANSLTHIVLDEDISVEAATTYHVYVRHDDDTVDVREVDTTGAPYTAREFDLAGGEPNFSTTPAPRDALWAFGESSPEGAIKEFRVIDLKLTNDWMVQITGLEHNSTIFDDETPVPLDTISRLFNPLGPPPPLLTLYATADERLGLDGIPRPVVTLEWEVQSLQVAGNAYAQYGGALIFRRYVRVNAQAGKAIAGETAFAAQLGATNSPDPFVLIANIQGGETTNYQDPVPIAGATYQYKVVPTSRRGIPNDIGSLTVEVTVASGGLQANVPDAPTNLRLLNGDTATTFSTSDAQFAWDLPAATLKTILEVWDTNQDTRLRGPLTISDQKFTYTRDQNEADSARILGLAPGAVYATRAIDIRIRAKNDYGLLSAVTSLSVSNPAPDMSSVTPTLAALVNGLYVDWTAYSEPPDTTFYDVYYGTASPPGTLLTGQTRYKKTVSIPNLTADTTYYVQIIPYDLFGPGTGSAIANAAPNLAASEWAFFVRQFFPDGIEFQHNDVDTVSWSAGTLNYIDDSGTAQSASIASGNDTWSSGSIFIYYTLGGSVFQTTTNILTALGSNKAVMAVYSGGANLVILFGKAIVHGSDIVASSIAANKLAVSQLSAISADVGILTSGLIRDTNSKFNISLTNRLITMIDEQGSPVTRLEIGELDTGASDWGIRIYDASGVLIFSSASPTQSNLIAGSISGQGALATQGSVDFATGEVTNKSPGNLSSPVVWGSNPITSGNISTYMASAAIQTAYIGDLQVDTIKIANSAVSNQVTSSDDATNLINNTEETLLSVSLSVFNILGYVVVIAKCYGVLDSGESLTLRLREDNLTGTVIDTTILDAPSDSVSYPASLIARFVPDATETKTFVMTGQAGGAYNVAAVYMKMIGIYLLK